MPRAELLKEEHYRLRNYCVITCNILGNSAIQKWTNGVKGCPWINYEEWNQCGYFLAFSPVFYSDLMY